jgi:hypothetical protein
MNMRTFDKGQQIQKELCIKMNGSTHNWLFKASPVRLGRVSFCLLGSPFIWRKWLHGVFLIKLSLNPLGCAWVAIHLKEYLKCAFLFEKSCLCLWTECKFYEKKLYNCPKNILKKQTRTSSHNWFSFMWEPEVDTHSGSHFKGANQFSLWEPGWEAGGHSRTTQHWFLLKCQTKFIVALGEHSSKRATKWNLDGFFSLSLSLSPLHTMFKYCQYCM